MKRVVFISGLLIASILIRAQHISMLTENYDCSIRGLSAVSDQVIWVSGSKGTVGLSLNAGDSWKWMTVSHFETMDFRDIEAFSDKEAIIMGVTGPSVILKTTDGGQSWRTVFRDSSSGMFLDAMDFVNDRGIVVGDPIKDTIYLAETTDRGEHWEKKPMDPNQSPASGEAFFASSGTNIAFFSDTHRFAYVSGGMATSLYIDSTNKIPLSIIHGTDASGANAIAINPFDPDQAIVVGGDYKKDKDSEMNCILINLQTLLQTKPAIGPHGYRSCVSFINQRQVIACGTSGVDFSDDGGLNWKLIDPRGFNVCNKSKAGKNTFLAGSKGRIAVLIQ